ncbi:MAG: hypothetical protein KAW12_30315 [Candidatus Aminicenantes bacterium]|nr:hypothetical protein [Candidatus Aminicenantes bacterium]
MEKKTAFVIMPFDKAFDSIYKKFIKESLEEVGFKTVRADDISNQQNILQIIVSGINSADLVVADLTNSNPNVYYEVGIAHTLNKPTIFLIQEVDDIPFDLRSYNVLWYSTHFEQFEESRKKLTKIAQEFFKDEILYSNPVNDFLAAGHHLELRPSTEIQTTEKQNQLARDSGENKGYIDHILAVEEGYARLTEAMNTIVEAQKQITSETYNFGDRIKKAKSSGGSKTTSQIMALCQVYSKQLDVYSDVLKRGNDDYESVSKNVQNSLEYIVIFQHKFSEENKDQTKSFLDNLIPLKHNMVELSIAVSNQRAQIDESITSFERKITLAAKSVMYELNRLAANLATFISSIERAFQAAEKLSS